MFDEREILDWPREYGNVAKDAVLQVHPRPGERANESFETRESIEKYRKHLPSQI